MLPIRDNIPAARFPGVTLAIIILNGIVFLHELQIGPRRLPDLFLVYGVVPARYTVSEVAHLFTFSQQIFSLISSMFLHGGWIHLIGNLWTLWIFGDNVEDRLGRSRYVMLYLAGGIAAAVLHIATNSASIVPTVGASGAIAAVMGAYFRFYPFAKVETLIPPFFFGPTFVLPAILFLGWWFIVQFFNGAMSLKSMGQEAGGIAWGAHVGGFLFGFLICLAARREPSEAKPPLIRNYY